MLHMRLKSAGLLRVVTAAALVFSLGANARAQFEGGADAGLNIDMNRTSGIGAGVPASTYGAAAGQPGFWNSFLVSGPTSINLGGLTGAPSGVVLRRISGGGIQSSCPSGSSADFSRLMCDYDYAVAGVVNPIEYRLENLLPGGYAVIVYAGRSDTPNPFHTQLWVNTTMIGQDLISGTVQANTFALGVTHTQRNVTIGPGDTLRIFARDSSGEFGDPVSICGIQLVRVGEPTATITAPAAFSCACTPLTITGTASGAGFAGYLLEYSATGGEPWTLIATGANPVTNGTLATWNPNLPEGYYVLRLTVQNTSGVVSTAVVVVYLNAEMNPVIINAPVENQILSGTICFDGTVWDQCGSDYQIIYRAVPPMGGFSPVDPAMPTYPGQLINLPLGTWNTAAGPTAVADGTYQVRIVGTNDCGDSFGAQRNLIVDNTAPVAEITSPDSCTAVSGVVPIIGTASDANLSGWVVQYVGGNQNQWVTIASGNTNVVSGVLANWNTTGLLPCCYAVRVVVTDSALVSCTSFTHQSEFVVLVDLSGECAGDFNRDGVLNSADFFDYLSAFFAGCP